MRVLLVDDSAIFREIAVERLAHLPGISVVGVAGDGVEAVKRARELAPDVVVMDVIMPRLDGIAAVAQIMGTTPLPILLISGDDRRSSTAQFDAMRAGALDVRLKPRLDDLADWRAFGEHIRLLAGVKVVHHMSFGLARAAGLQRTLPASAPTPAPTAAAAEGRNVVVAIAASTGGPAAIASVLSALPKHFTAPVLVVQHLDAAFTDAFAGWLAAATGRVVRIAGQPHDVVGPGDVVVAPARAHLTLQRGFTTRGFTTRALEGAPVDGHVPSATVLFRSLAATLGARAVGVLLTGMGRDGADGLLDIKRAGGAAVVEDAGAVVDGMPRSARASGAATTVAPLAGIAAALVAAVEARGG